MASILLVDHPETITSLVNLLTTCGHHCYPAENAWQGLAALETGPVDLVVLNLQIPGLSGLAFLEDLRRHRNPHLSLLPTIVLADDADAEVRRSLRVLRVSACLDRSHASPFEFLDTVRATLADPAGHRWRYGHVA